MVFIFGLPMALFLFTCSYNGFCPGDGGKNIVILAMNSHQRRRLWTVIVFVIGLSVATGFIFYAFKQNLNVFLTPHQLADKQIHPGEFIRLGGLVKPGSVERDSQGLGTKFIITDNKQELKVRYAGVLPDLFREGKGVIAEGRLGPENIFIATQVLAKHDENYLPKNVYQELRR